MLNNVKKKLILSLFFFLLVINIVSADLQFTDSFGHNIQIQTIETGNLQFNYFLPTANMTVNDTMNPKLDNVSNLSIYATAVTIHFDTDEQVSYDIYIDDSIESESILYYSPFNIVIEGLYENTNYVWNVTVCDFWGNCNSSLNYNFTTFISAGSGAPGGGITEVPTTTTTLRPEEPIEEDFIENVEEFLEDITTPLPETSRTRLLSLFNNLKVKYKSLIILSFFTFLFLLSYDRKTKKFKLGTSLVLSLLLSLVYYETSKPFIMKFGRWWTNYELFAGCIVLSLILIGLIYLFKKAKKKTKGDKETKKRKLNKRILTITKIIVALVLIILIYPIVSPLFTNLGKNLSISILSLIVFLFSIHAMRVFTGNNEGKKNNLKKTIYNILKLGTISVFGILIYPYLVEVPLFKWSFIIISILILMTIKNKLNKIKDSEAKKKYISKTIMNIVKVLLVLIIILLSIKYTGNLSIPTFAKEQPFRLVGGIILTYVIYKLIKKQIKKKKSEF